MDKLRGGGQCLELPLPIMQGSTCHAQVICVMVFVQPLRIIRRKIQCALLAETKNTNSDEATYKSHCAPDGPSKSHKGSFTKLINKEPHRGHSSPINSSKAFSFCSNSDLQRCSSASSAFSSCRARKKESPPFKARRAFSKACAALLTSPWSLARSVVSGE